MAAMHGGGRVGTMRKKGEASIPVGWDSLPCERVRREEALAGRTDQPTFDAAEEPRR